MYNLFKFYIFETYGFINYEKYKIIIKYLKNYHKII